MTLTLKEVAELVGGSIEGDSSKSIQGIGALDSANSSQISYAVNEYAIEEGYDLILYKYVVFVSDKVNITQQIIEKIEKQ